MIYQIVAVVGLFGSVMLGAGLWSVRSSLEACEKLGAERQQTIADLTAAAAVQEDAVRRLRAKGAAAVKAASTAREAAKQASAASQSAIEALQGRILAPAHADCAAAMVEIREALK